MLPQHLYLACELVERLAASGYTYHSKGGKRWCKGIDGITRDKKYFMYFQDILESNEESDKALVRQFDEYVRYCDAPQTSINMHRNLKEGQKMEHEHDFWKEVYKDYFSEVYPEIDTIMHNIVNIDGKYANKKYGDHCIGIEMNKQKKKVYVDVKVRNVPSSSFHIEYVSVERDGLVTEPGWAVRDDFECHLIASVAPTPNLKQRRVMIVRLDEIRNSKDKWMVLGEDCEQYNPGTVNLPPWYGRTKKVSQKLLKELCPTTWIKYYPIKNENNV